MVLLIIFVLVADVACLPFIPNNDLPLTVSTRGTKRLPEALVIGAKKCGTRALLEFLRVHPDVRSAGPEIHFFDRHYSMGLDWYREQMPSALPGQITMEKTPSYFITEEAPERIYRMSPTTKLIIVVRDPVTRAISDYTQSTSKRKVRRSFEDKAMANGTVNTAWSAVRIGMYIRYIDYWLRYFPLQQIHFVNGEELISQPGTVMRRIQAFLGLSEIIDEGHFYFDEQKQFPCLKKGLRSGRPKCLSKNKGRRHPNVRRKVIRKLRDFYRPYNAKLEQLTGISFGY